MIKLSPDKSCQNAHLCLLRCCLNVWPRAIRSLLLFIFGVLQRPLTLLYTCLLMLLPEKKLFRIKVDDKKLKRKAPSLLCFFQVCCCMLSLGHLSFFCRMIVQQKQEFRREGWTEKRSAVRFCLGSGLFGSYNSD